MKRPSLSGLAALIGGSFSKKLLESEAIPITVSVSTILVDFLLEALSYRAWVKMLMHQNL
jgi:hypothetical protein